VLGSSIVAKLVSSSITYPHEVIRARLQDGRNTREQQLEREKGGGARRLNVITVTQDIIRKEGVAALWTGLRVNLIRILPATCTSFVCYEYMKIHLQNIDQQGRQQKPTR
jgi:solute carrier family 25 folate transporter 32